MAEHPEYEITLGGVPRRARFSMLECYKIDKMALANKQPSVMRLFTREDTQLNSAAMLDILLVGLRAYEPGLKLETLMEWLTTHPQDYMPAVQIVGNAMTRAYTGRDPALSAAPGGDAPGPLAQTAQPGAVEDTSSSPAATDTTA